MEEERENLEYFGVLSKIFHMDSIQGRKSKKFYENFYNLIRFDVYWTINFYEKTLQLFQKYSLSCDLENPKEFYMNMSRLYKILKKKYRYSFLKAQIKHEYLYFKESEFLYQNFGFLKKYFQSQITEEESQDYEYEIPIERSVEIIRDYLDIVDSTHSLVLIYDDCIKNHLEFIDNTEDFDFLDFWHYDLERDMIRGPYTNTIDDMFALLHEFIHYYILNLYPYNECFLPETYITYKELPSIYHEFHLSLYLEEHYQELKKDILSYEKNRKNEFLWQVQEDVMHESFQKLSVEKDFDLPQISSKMCDSMSERILEVTTGDSYDFYYYSLDYLIARELYEKVKNGDTNINQKIMEMMNMLTYTNMHPLYFLRFLGCYGLSYAFHQNGENVIPRCLEDKSLHF